MCITNNKPLPSLPNGFAIRVGNPAAVPIVQRHITCPGCGAPVKRGHDCAYCARPDIGGDA